ncbi:MAG TPA: tRNA (adenosine(37)-N6)-threonylcarbamoyltransferase complex transferase subunit TsaD [Candidatus Omnitrophota bacterium]|nr:tRNA (adenosine(37)-N6)-threonylcarbamoyltransferase complex transferase subunit TsaD [Candidatus Omnitrophota bacterium]
MPFYTLGIETSCDETSCAVLKGKDEILSNVVSSSLFRHKKFGGVVPEIASRHCMEQIQCVFEEALREAKVRASDLDLVAVTRGPGLIGSLFVGVAFAKALAYQLGIPVVGVNHMEAHLVANFLKVPGTNSERVQEPVPMVPGTYIGLLVSGGHTMLTHCEKGKITVLGETVDDAVGEAYDKVAKIMGLSYPGGPVIDKLARQGDSRAVLFTKPKQAERFNFSFSGIKTAVLYLLQDPKTGKPKPGAPSTADIAASFQHAVIGWLVEKAIDACQFKGVSDIVVGGGVSANSYLREKLARQAAMNDIKVWFPPVSLSTDNAAMIARRGFELHKNGIRSSLHMTADPGLAFNVK